jgi:WD40 repeat protein
MLIALDLDGNLGKRSQRAITILRRNRVTFDVVKVADEHRYRHPATVATGCFLFPQLLYKGQFLGSLEFIEEWSRRREQGSGHVAEVAVDEATRNTGTSGDCIPAWSMDLANGLCATACADGRIRTHEEDGLGLASVVQATNSWLNTIRAVGRGQFVAGGSDGSLYAVRPQEDIVKAVVASAHAGWLNAVAYDRSVNVVLTGGSDQWIRAWRPNDWSLVREWRTPDAWVNALVARNGTFWAALSSGQIMGGCYSRTHSDRAMVVSVDNHCLNTIDMNDEGEVVVGGFHDSPILIEPKSGTRVSLGGDSQIGGLWGVRFVGDGAVLTAGADGRLLRRDIASGTTSVLLDANEPLIALTVGRVRGGGAAFVFVRGQGPTMVELGRADAKRVGRWAGVQ